MKAPIHNPVVADFARAKFEQHGRGAVVIDFNRELGLPVLLGASRKRFRALGVRRIARRPSVAPRA